MRDARMAQKTEQLQNAIASAMGCLFGKQRRAISKSIKTMRGEWSQKDGCFAAAVRKRVTNEINPALAAFPGQQSPSSPKPGERELLISRPADQRLH